MKIVLNEWFKLPRLGKETFIKLMSIGVKYDKTKGFLVNEGTNLLSFSSVIKEALREEVEFYPKCAIDELVTPCDICAYREVCDRKEISSKCLCDECYNNRDIFTFYTTNLASKIE
ncbi:MAG: hypothetical protein QXX95_01265 [Nitrososphaerales archaeon]